LVPMKKLLRSAGLSAALLAIAASPVLAQTEFKFVPPANIPSLGELLSNILVLLFFFAAILAFVFIVLGGLQWIMAGGDKQAASNARDRITAAVIGLVIVVAAFAITVLITSALHINIFSPEGIKLPNGGSVFGQ
jgi:heme/copper-type cytochrome/quinol oxidase subunit 2